MTNATEEFNSFLEAQKVEGYNLGDITGSPEGDMLKYTELKIAVVQEAEKLKAFNAEKDAAFQTLATKHDEERIALGVIWQTKEDAL